MDREETSLSGESGKKSSNKRHGTTASRRKSSLSIETQEATPSRARSFRDVRMGAAIKVENFSRNLYNGIKVEIKTGHLGRQKLRGALMSYLKLAI